MNTHIALTTLAFAALPTFLLSSNTFGQANAPAAEGFNEIVVTAGRTATARGDVPQQIELINELQLSQTPASFITDVLKKNASVDIIQYPSGLSGIGMRGFRPQFSGINQQVLVLVDGRPSGVTNLGVLPQSNIQRVEVMKGASSSVYGASAMGGVVNFITRESKGDLAGGLNVRTGSYGTLRAGFNIGGSVTDNVDFDFGLEERSQSKDYKMGGGKYVYGSQVLGDGATRPYTSYETRSAFARLGADINESWRADLRLNAYQGRDVRAPGAESDGRTGQASRDGDVWTVDGRINGIVGAHDLLAVVYLTSESDERTDVVNNVLLLAGADTKTEAKGLQIRDAWSFADNYTLIAGIDLEETDRGSTRYGPAGQILGAFAPDETREAAGVYADVTARWLDERLILNAGARIDRISSSLEPTAMRPDFVPGTSRFETTNPRAGIVYYPFESRSVRVHSSIGSGYVVPAVRQVAGSTESIAGGQLRIVTGNPDLKPESSDSFDIGVGYEGALWGGDITWFRTDIKDKIESVVTLNTTARRITTSVNARSALAQGYEASLDTRIGGLLGLSPNDLTLALSATYYTDNEQELATGLEPIRNVARFKINGSLSFDNTKYGLRLNARHVTGMNDGDFSVNRIFTNGAGGVFTYPDVTVVDLDARYYLSPNHTLGFQVENLENKYYFEKNDYPMQGRTFLASYRYTF
ncbi:MAG: TonB-dependent receptor [Moraxellaceae bacterium]|nr:TonB-dependent receptor [Moraxellaceae bacterium]